ncbi:tyrosine-protein phosphatase [Kribbia dieselivorans]|uniref:tyrosine-protein phosphatase n=1 Tax=Kribbia dieselivorans TaxID=331526 RepID=UPI000A5B0D77|nr:tyrosine-protein phosphatase [Kribbia dieselivorans]
MSNERWIQLDGVVNMRDLGGLPTRESGVTAPRRLIRSDNLQDLSAADVRRLIDELGVTDIVDLRSQLEYHTTGPGPLRATALRHHHHSFLRDDTHDVTAAEALALKPRFGPGDGDRTEDYWSRHYLGYLRGRPDSVSAALEVIATSEGATVVHCAAGKDRTGTVIGLALDVAGVPAEEIIADYVASAQRIEQIIERLMHVPPYNTALQRRSIAEQTPQPPAMEAILSYLHTEYQGAGGWLVAHGWTEEQVDGLRRSLVTPA